MIDEDELLDEILVEEEPNLPEGKVLVTSHRSGGNRRFHTDTDCQYVTENHKEWDRETAESWGFEKCRSCKGETFGGYNARD